MAGNLTWNPNLPSQGMHDELAIGYSSAEELNSLKALPASYIYNTESKAWRITKLVISIIIFPIGIYNLLHSLMGKVMIIASRPRSIGPEYAGNYALECRQHFDPEWRYKRFTVKVDGTDIDAYIMTKPETVNNGRWVLNSNGVGQFAEERCFSDPLPPEGVPQAEPPKESYAYRQSMGQEFKQILTSLESNAIVFNYPGVASSGGMPNRKTMTKAYQAMLAILEDQKIGLKAEEIIGYGHSIGGGVQAEALKTHQLKDGIDYVFVKSRTFSALSQASSTLFSDMVDKFLSKGSSSLGGRMAGAFVGIIAGIFVKIFGWNFDSVQSSVNLRAPEIILQTATVSEEEGAEDSHRELFNAEDAEHILSEEAITKQGSLGKAVLNQKDQWQAGKRIFGIRQMHSAPLLDRNLTFLTDAIKDCLPKEVEKKVEALPEGLAA